MTEASPTKQKGAHVMDDPTITKAEEMVAASKTLISEGERMIAAGHEKLKMARAICPHPALNVTESTDGYVVYPVGHCAVCGASVDVPERLSGIGVVQSSPRT